MDEALAGADRCGCPVLRRGRSTWTEHKQECQDKQTAVSIDRVLDQSRRETQGDERRT